MNRVKQLAVFLLVFVMMFGLSVPVYANGSDTLELKNLVNSTYMGGMCTVSYYHPVGYPNVWVGFGSYGGGYSDGGNLYVIYYKDGTRLNGTSTGMSFSEEVYLTIVKSKAAAEDILFNGITADFQLTTSGGPAWSNPLIYTTDKFAMRENGNPKTLEAYYYDWYFEQNGFYPVGINLKLHYMCNGELIGTQEIETVAGTNILLQDIIEEPDGYKWTTININGTEYQKADTYYFTEHTDITILMEQEESGLIGSIWNEIKNFFGNVPDAFDKIMEFINNIYNPDIDFLAEVNNKLAVKLEDNGFYTSICRIQRELTSLYNEDYTSRTGFAELGLTKLHLRKPYETITVDFGNEIIGPMEQNYTVYTSKIDWGLESVDVMPMGWFFGEKIGVAADGNTPYYSKGVKAMTDPLISAFLWIAFAFMIWQRLPDIISGELSTMTAITSDVINTSVAGNRSVEDVYTTRTVEINTETGEVLKDKTKTQTRTKEKRRVKK